MAFLIFFFLFCFSYFSSNKWIVVLFNTGLGITRCAFCKLIQIVQYDKGICVYVQLEKLFFLTSYLNIKKIKILWVFYFTNCNNNNHANTYFKCMHLKYNIVFQDIIAPISLTSPLHLAWPSLLLINQPRPH